MRDLHGPLVPIPSAFVDDTSLVSEVRLARLVRWYRECGAEGFVLNSDLGEFTALSIEERMAVVEIVQRELQGQMPFLVHLSTLSTTQSLYLAQHASRCGARAGLLMPPFYYRLRDDELISFFGTITEHADLPIILIDPVGLITPGVMEGLRDIGGLVQARPLAESPHQALALRTRAASDEFWLEDAYSSAMLALTPPTEVPRGSTLESYRQLFRSGGSLRVVKAGLNLQDRDVGPTRGPFLGLEQDLRDELRRLGAG